MKPPKELYLTNDDEANSFIARDPLALLIGLVLHRGLLGNGAKVADN